MIETHRTQWLYALRSGEYEQGVGALRFGNQFCAIGLLCEVASIQSEPTDAGIWKFGKEGARGRPPVEIYKVTGITNLQVRQIEQYNDGGATFPEIADRIEEIIPA